MRPSRTISPTAQAVSATDGVSANQTRPVAAVTLPGMTVAGEVQAGADLPAWQSAFILGPNVRFTRTPESAYARKPAPVVEVPQADKTETAPAEPTAAADEAAASPAAVVPPDLDSAVMRKIESGYARPVATEPRHGPPEATAAQSVEGDNGALALYLRLKREMTEVSRDVRSSPPARSYPALRAAEPAPLQNSPQAQTPQTAALLPRSSGAFSLSISDYALWEIMNPDVDLTGLAPADRVALPRFDAGASSPASLYREVVVRRGKGSAAVPNNEMPAATATRTDPVQAQRAETRPVTRSFASGSGGVAAAAGSPVARPEAEAHAAAEKALAPRAPISPVVSRSSPPSGDRLQSPVATLDAAETRLAPAAPQLAQVSVAASYASFSALPSLSAFQAATVQVTATAGGWQMPPLMSASLAASTVDTPAVAAAEEEEILPPTGQENPAVPAERVAAVARVTPVASRSLARSGLFAAADSNPDYEFPPVDLLQQPSGEQAHHSMTQEALEQSAGLLESILEDFGVKGEIIDVRPGPVVTLYEFEPAPGVKSSRVIGLADDIARSMSALSARVAVVPGRNVIGIELPNAVRETVYFRELIECESYWETKFKLALCLGKTIGGEPVVAELAKMPHLLVAGTTGSGKSVAINTMILSLLYRLRPEECRLIMVDPKMLELSVYDGIPHLLTPVVTDPKKAVMALKWAVREMEDRYRKMSRLGVRNIDGFNARAAAARAKGETVMCDVPKGFDRGTGEPVYEQEEMDLTPMPYIVVIVDEMADLMMVAGKEIEGAIQRLAQMARAAGIHLIMATQRPSVDVITGTIKANFPTRISFQVTSKIDSRTILGEQGAEHLLGQGDMLHMIGGGRIARVHGPFVSDAEVEAVVAHLKTQGRPEYLGTVTEDADEEEAPEPEDSAVFDKSAMGEEDGDDLYDKAVKVVLRDRKCSTSYIQRRLSIGYNRAASLVERMEKEGLVGPSNHVGKREILNGSRDTIPAVNMPDDDD
ncbi:DNA translocase FtsK [Mycoplana dimorpha]|uniref:S-DNA-T family DNA segregation ATPase FtsK/SpoIIIE n=1 Tax=Mycoplana dimorpha TaxID=28320 RepID=A0A2T5B348_MYCDI|nr:DNA translocase FtsK [Mycoplana dimorpha]PTM93392.1 S-DNA-T family DNA segregation ATPase FtsK/SpoIIIE [Mycoplana dimorpha]